MEKGRKEGELTLAPHKFSYLRTQNADWPISLGDDAIFHRAQFDKTKTEIADRGDFIPQACVYYSFHLNVCVIFETPKTPGHRSFASGQPETFKMYFLAPLTQTSVRFVSFLEQHL